MNVLQWHIIDGQSFPLESKQFPALAEKGRYCRTCTYSQQDIRELVTFARDRGVRVIPELDIPGHSGFQYGMPEIVACPFDRSGAGSNRALDPTLNETYRFLTEFLSEQATLFGDPVMNVYGDEVRFPCWNSSSSIKKWMQEHGLAVGDFQGLTRMFWKRFATEVAPVVFNRTGVAIMIGQADVRGWVAHDVSNWGRRHHRLSALITHARRHHRHLTTYIFLFRPPCLPAALSACLPACVPAALPPCRLAALPACLPPLCCHLLHET